MLGLGLGLSKGTNLLSNLKLLTRNSDWAIWGDKATGTSKGTNSPQVNPIVDLVGNADGTLQGFGFIPTSGYADVPIKGLGDEISYTNLVTNPSFEDALTGNWVTDSGSATETIDSSIFLFGTKSLKLAITISSFLIKKNPVNFLTGKRYYISANHRHDIIANSLGVRIYAGTTIKATFTTELTSLNVWKKSSGIYTTVGGETDISVIAAVPALKNGNFWHDGVQAINLTDNPQVQALESKLGRQLTAAECDYLFDLTATTNTIKAKVVTGIQGDVANDVIVLPSNAPNPTTGSFAFGLVVKTGANKVKYWLTRNATNDADTQYAFKMDASGNLFVILEGIAIQIGTALSVGFHSIWLERDSGTLKAFIDGVETYSGAHSTTLTSRPNTVMMASTTGAGTYTGFSNDLLLATKYCDSDIATNREDWFKFDTKVYGL